MHISQPSWMQEIYFRRGRRHGFTAGDLFTFKAASGTVTYNPPFVAVATGAINSSAFVGEDFGRSSGSTSTVDPMLLSNHPITIWAAVNVVALPLGAAAGVFYGDPIAALADGAAFPLHSNSNFFFGMVAVNRAGSIVAELWDFGNPGTGGFLYDLRTTPMGNYGFSTLASFWYIFRLDYKPSTNNVAPNGQISARVGNVARTAVTVTTALGFTGAAATVGAGCGVFEGVSSGACSARFYDLNAFNHGAGFTTI